MNLDYDLAAFNKSVHSESFNRVVCQAIAAEIPPDRLGKTLIFAARDSHADDVVRLLTQARPWRRNTAQSRPGWCRRSPAACPATRI